ncbi:hypothetical protein PAXRUDRAFT_159404, partial [Paxillus rubicundulus Ve08.2h10]
NTHNMQECLAEAMLEIGELPDSAINLGDWEDINNGQDFSYFEPFSSEEDDGELESVPAAFSKPVACHHQDNRSHLQCNHHTHQAWQGQMPALVDWYLAWKHNQPADNGDNVEMITEQHTFYVDIIGVFNYEPCVPIAQRSDEPANSALICAGLLGSTPLQPISFTRHLRVQFAATFDTYLDIKQHIQSTLERALGRDGPRWKLSGACPPCAFKQSNEPLLSPARLHNMDGNMLAKHLDGSGSSDPRVFASSYFISDLEIEQFKDDVRNQPGNRSDVATHPGACTNNWIAAKSVEEDKVQVFEQTGIFLLACCHGFVECIAEMKRSGELMKYGLMAINQILNICGNDQVIGHDIGCASCKTLAASSLGMKTKEEKLRVVVNMFHGFAHNHLCQLQNHPLYLTGFGNEDLKTCKQIFLSSNSTASLICHGLLFHWKQFLDLHFDQWDRNRYLELSKYEIALVAALVNV